MAPDGETRLTSSTGASKGDKIYRFDQIPADPMLELAARYGLGSTKYPAVNGLDNWRNGYAFSLSLAALERHVNAFKRGEDNDATIYAEAGLLNEGEDPLYDQNGQLRPGVSHLAAAVWHCFFLMHHLQHHPELDDRPTTVLRRTAAGVAGTEEAADWLESTDGQTTGYVEEASPRCQPAPYSEECEECEEFQAERRTEVKQGDSLTLDDWQDVGITEDGSVFVAPVPWLKMPDYSNVTIKPEDLEEPGSLILERTDGDSYRRTYIPRPKMTQNEDGSISIQPLAAHEIPLSVGTPVLARLADSTEEMGERYIWTRIDEVAAHEPIGDEPRWYTYTVYDWIAQVAVQVDRDELYVRA